MQQVVLDFTDAQVDAVKAADGCYPVDQLPAGTDDAAVRLKWGEGRMKSGEVREVLLAAANILVRYISPIALRELCRDTDTNGAKAP
jgi:hypothetical protein